MATRAKARAAIQAMKELGIPETKTKPVLKKLLNLFEKNWDLIEEENYRLLADSIFEDEDTEAAEKEKKKQAATAVTDQREALAEEVQTRDEVERPLKRLRLKHQGQASPSHGQSSPNSGTGALKIPKPEPGEPETFPIQRVQSMTTSPQCNAGNRRAESQPVSPQLVVKNKGKQPISPQNTGAKESVTPGGTQRDKRASLVLQFKEPKVEPGVVPTGKNKQEQPDTTALIKPKDEPFTDDMLSLEPLAVVLPERSHPEAQLNSSNPVDSQDGKLPDNGTTKTVNGAGKDIGTLPLVTTEDNRLKEADVAQIGPANIDIASSSQGEVKLCLSCITGPYLRELQALDIEAILKKVEDNCIRTYKVMNSEFSVTKIMKELCEGILERGMNADGVTQERASPQDSQVINDKGHSSVSCLNGYINAESFDNVVATSDIGATDVSSSNPQSDSNGQKISLQHDKNATDIHCAEGDLNNVKDMSMRSLVVVQQPHQLLDPDDIRCLYDMTDITRGEEEIKVSLEKSSCGSLPFFHYITQNVVSHNARVVFSLAQIGDQNCCISCDGDCLSSSPPCNCAQREGESPYTSDGLVREEFLDECILMIRNPQKHNLMYCRECPLERLKNEDMLDPCKGHLKRKFIKECWTKCDCNKFCGNRVVQGGIRCNLQVFWTTEGKGWGVRTLEDLPKGSFVCEYVGEILTNTELRNRNLRRSSGNHSYSVVLDADWGSRALMEEEVLCLDATFYGNVARFINHRCSDANLIEIPVEVETPDHHYYHVALFTARKVDAFEELTWDYGVDFDDNEHHIKAFRCLCGSKFCRNMKRSSRSRSSLTLR